MAAQPKGDQRRLERITFLLTRDEKERIERFALSRHMQPGVFVRHVVLIQIQTKEAATA